MSSLCIIVYATFREVLPLAIVLATCTLMVAIIRMGFSFRQLQTLAESKREARTDELTGLPNRRLFYETLRTALEPGSGGQSLAVLMIDLDRFKEINDSLGHHVGDEVLRQLGPRLAKVVDGAGTVARLGGDEFGLLLSPLDDPAQATEVAERVRDDLRRSFLLESITLHVDASIGIAIAPDHGEDAATLLQRADVAMYEAKRNHDAWQLYSPFRDRHTRDRLELMEDVRDAIGRGELVLYYQPKLDLASRDGHRRGGAGPLAAPRPRPADTGPLPQPLRAERPHGPAGHDDPRAGHGPAGRVGARRPPPLHGGEPVGRQPGRRAAAGQGHRAVRPAGRLPGRRRPRDHRGQPHGRRRAEPARCWSGSTPRASQLSVDDYGTGFSSLAYLRDLPVHELKLDRAFLAAAADDERAVAIIRSTIDLAHSLDLRIVAEGVETDANLALIAELGCDTAQGYLLGRPAPADALFPARPSAGAI